MDGGSEEQSTNDMDDEEQEMEVMAALCDKVVRSAAILALGDGSLPTVDGLVDGSGIDSAEEIKFVEWWSNEANSGARDVRIQFLEREIEAAKRDDFVLDEALSNPTIIEDAMIANVVVNQDDSRSKLTARDWITSEKENINYEIEEGMPTQPLSGTIQKIISIPRSTHSIAAPGKRSTYREFGSWY